MTRSRPVGIVGCLAVLAALVTPMAAGAPAAVAQGAGTSAPAASVTLLAGPSVGHSLVPALPSRGGDVGIESATIQVNYSGFSGPAQTAFQYAVDRWEELITSPVTITIDASFTPLGSGVLGQAGPNNIWRDQCAMQANTWYVDALANAICGFDLSGATTEGSASFNSNFSNWYFGTDGLPGAMQYDFVSVVMHEIGHVLGFLGSMSVSNTSGVGSWGFGFSPFPAVYDRFAENGANQALLSFGNNTSALGTQLRSNSVYFDGPQTTAANGGTPARLFAPSTWQSGSSYSHLNESTYPVGNPSSLMTPSLGSGEAIHSPGGVGLGILGDSGWSIPIAPGAPLTPVATGGSGQASVAFSPPASNGGSAITTYTVTASPGGASGSGPTSPVHVGGLANGTSYTFTVTATNSFGTGPASATSNAVTPALRGYHAIDPVRILDTRFGSSAQCPTCQGIVSTLSPGSTKTVRVDGNDVPTSGVSAVVVNVTATAPTANGWFTVWDTGAAPTASNLNFTAGQTVANLVTVKTFAAAGPSYTVQLGNTVGCACAGPSVHAIFDVVGWYDDGTVAGEPFEPLPAGPVRILDTRFGQSAQCTTCTPGSKSTPFAPQQTYDVQLAGIATVPNDATAVVLNVTATGPSAPGWLTVFPTGAGSPPVVSNLNFTAGQTVPNLVKVRLGTGGQVSIANTVGSAAAGTANVVVDVVGSFGPSAGNDGLNAVTPVRILDTRVGVAGANPRNTPLAPQESATVQVAGFGGVPMTGATAVLVNVTATAPTAAGWLTLWPGGVVPTASNLNFAAGQTVPNLAVVALGPGGTVQLGNTNGNPAAGFTHAIFDIVGWYA